METIRQAVQFSNGERPRLPFTSHVISRGGQAARSPTTAYCVVVASSRGKSVPPARVRNGAGAHAVTRLGVLGYDLFARDGEKTSGEWLGERMNWTEKRCILPEFRVLPKWNFVKERLAIRRSGAYILKCLQTTVAGVTRRDGKVWCCQMGV